MPSGEPCRPRQPACRVACSPRCCVPARLEGSRETVVSIVHCRWRGMAGRRVASGPNGCPRLSPAPTARSQTVPTSQQPVQIHGDKEVLSVKRWAALALERRHLLGSGPAAEGGESGGGGWPGRPSGDQLQSPPPPSELCWHVEARTGVSGFEIPLEELRDEPAGGCPVRQGRGCELASRCYVGSRRSGDDGKLRVPPPPPSTHAAGPHAAIC